MAIFTNRATLSYNNQSVSSNIATGELLEVLTVTKTAVTETYGSDSDITYVVSILNSGNAPFPALTVTDDLGGGTNPPLTYVAGSARLFINGALAAAPTVTAGSPLTFTGIGVPAGGNVLLIYEAEATEFAPLASDSTITNVATVSGAGVTTPVTATAVISVRNAPELGITKSISPSVVTENSRVTYSFVIRNAGNTAAVATDNVTVTDLFDPILTDLAVALDGTPLAEGTGYTYNEASGNFATVPGVITVPAATFTQDPVSGATVTTPGVVTLTVTGTI